MDFNAVSLVSAGGVAAQDDFGTVSLDLGGGLTGTVAFLKNLDVSGGLTTAVGNYGVTIAKSPDSIGGSTVFRNRGPITLGGQGAVNFVGGVTANAPSQIVNLLGNLRTESGGIVLGTVRLQSTGDIRLAPVGGNIQLGSVTGTARNLILETDAGRAVTITGNTTLTGGFSATTDSLTFPGSLRSTDAGTIRVTPRTVGRGIRLGNAAAGNVLNLGTLLDRTFTRGRVEIGSATTGAITVVGRVAGSASGLSRFLLRNGSGGLNFAVSGQPSGQIFLPQGTAVDWQVVGDIRGSFTPTAVGLSLSAPGGHLNLLSAGSVTLGTDVASVLAGAGLNPAGGFVLVNQSSLAVAGSYDAGVNDLLIQTLSGNLQINQGASFEGRELTLAPAANFYNYAGSTPFQNNANGRTVVYSYQSNLNQPNTADAGLSGFEWTFRTPQIIGNYGFGSYTIDASEIPSGNAVVYAGNPVIPDLPTGTGLVEGFVNTATYMESVPTLGYPMPRAFEGSVRLGFKSGLARKGAPAGSVAGEASPASGKGEAQEESPDRLRLRDMTEDRPAASEGEKVGQQEGNPGRLKVGQVARPAAPEAKTAETTPPTPNPRERQGRPVSLRFSEEYLPFEVRPVTEASGKVSDRR